MVNQIKEIMEFQGFHVVTSLCGSAALEKVKVGRYFCAVLDYALPDMKGDKLAKKIRRLRPDIGIVLLSGFKSNIDPSSLGVFDYCFEKPVLIEELVAAMVKIDSAYRLRTRSKESRVIE